MEQRTRIRHELRNRRRHLSNQAQKAGATSACANIIEHPLLQHSQQIALYIANDGELDPEPLLKACHEKGHRCYLPRLDPNKEFGMLFLSYKPGDLLKTNRYGINEPLYDENKVCPPQALDIVLTPLVQFDLKGNRIGMGAGFYDRCFAFTKTQAHHTLLLGLAYDFQKVDKIKPEPWDVSLDGIITDQNLYLINPTLKEKIA